MPPHWQGMMWGTLPLGSSLLAIVVVLILPEKKRRSAGIEAVAGHEDLVPGRLVS
jgi:hypothetical protein